MFNIFMLGVAECDDESPQSVLSDPSKIYTDVVDAFRVHYTSKGSQPTQYLGRRRFHKRLCKDV